MKTNLKLLLLSILFVNISCVTTSNFEESVIDLSFPRGKEVLKTDSEKNDEFKRYQIDASKSDGRVLFLNNKAYNSSSVMPIIKLVSPGTISKFLEKADTPANTLGLFGTFMLFNGGLTYGILALAYGFPSKALSGALVSSLGYGGIYLIADNIQGERKKMIDQYNSDLKKYIGLEK